MGGERTHGGRSSATDRDPGRLSGVEEDHDGYLAFCPAHNDRRHPSLKFTLKNDGMLLMVCRTGCEKADILKAANLTAADLYNVDGQEAGTISAKPPETVGPERPPDSACSSTRRRPHWQRRTKR
ncbi:hypothetical protein SMICM17S_01732 [Streptomyces microflavus]